MTERLSQFGSTKAAKWLAWGMAAGGMLMLAGLIGLQAAGCVFLVDPSQEMVAMAYGLGMLSATALGFSILGALIVTYRPTNRIGWLLSLAGFSMMFAFSTLGYTTCGLNGTPPLPGLAQAAWLGEMAWALALPLFMMLLPMLFPDGRFLSAAWRRFAIFAIVVLAVATLITALWPGPMGNISGDEMALNNPFGLDFQPTPELDALADEIQGVPMTVFGLAAIFSLVLRWRRSRGEVRQQLKWFAFFLGTAGLFFIGVEIYGSSVNPAIFEGWFYLFELFIFWLGFPVVIGIVIFKYRLYDIDIIIRKTLAYGALTISLILVYFGSVVLLQSIITAFSGGQSPIAIVISTLVIAALFNPLRTRIQGTIDRRFYRGAYDAEKALADFSSKARQEVDLNDLSGELLRVVQETMQPEKISLMLPARSDPGERYE